MASILSRGEVSQNKPQNGTFVNQKIEWLDFVWVEINPLCSTKRDCLPSSTLQIYGTLLHGLTPFNRMVLCNFAALTILFYFQLKHEHRPDKCIILIAPNCLTSSMIQLCGRTKYHIRVIVRHAIQSCRNTTYRYSSIFNDQSNRSWTAN